MHILALGISLFVGGAILAIGVAYLIKPWAIAPSFGLPLPDPGENTSWWLRLKGVRDITSGIVLLSLSWIDGHRTLGLVLLIFALVPSGDMSIILAGKGRTGTAIGVHGLTAALMVLSAVLLLVKAR